MSSVEPQSYFVFRNQAINSLDMFWKDFYTIIENEINSTFEKDENRRINLGRNLEDFNEIIIKFVNQLEYDKDNIKLLQDNEETFFNTRINDIKNWILDLFEIIIKEEFDKDNPDSLGTAMWEFEKLNYQLRYEDDINFKKSISNDELDCWKKANKNRLPIVYSNIFFHITKLRDHSTHYQTGVTKRIFRDIGRKEIEPITGAKGPGGLLVIAGSLISLIYGYHEILITMKESFKIHDGGGFTDSSNYFTKQKRRN